MHGAGRLSTGMSHCMHPLRLSRQHQLLLCVVNYKAYVHPTVIERTLL